MDKKTILRYVLAIALSAGLVGVFAILQSTIFKSTIKPQEQNLQTDTRDLKADEPPKSEEPGVSITPIEDKNLTEGDKSFSTKYYQIVFGTKGGVVKSLRFNDFKEIDGKPIELIVSANTGIYPFGIKFGDYNTENDIFEYSEIESENAVVFKRDYKLTEGENTYEFSLAKKYIFAEDYIVDLMIYIEFPDSKYIPLNFSDKMYVLNFGPQIGPGFKDQLESNEFRKFTYYDNGRKDMTGDASACTFSAPPQKRRLIDKGFVRWAAIEGKYFLVIAKPPEDFIDKHVGFDETQIDGLSKHSSMFFEKGAKKVAVVEDSFKFYIGPKKKDILEKHAKYDFQKAIEDDFLFGWLIDILKWILQLFNNVAHNWGVSIIILTILIKAAFFPITQKGLKASTRMQSLSPRLEEIRAKYKSDPQKVQAETAALYKKEGINPLSGCLPMLIQLPFFIALYGLLSNHFELRGAIFIPGWINDLSAPESILTLPFTIPIFNTDQLRLLPFLVLATQFIQQKLTPAAGGATANQMKIMLYALPVVFFFIMYPFPSGLNLYWTVQNLLSIVNQVYNNVVMKKPIVAANAITKKK